MSRIKVLQQRTGRLLRKTRMGTLVPEASRRTLSKSRKAWRKIKSWKKTLRRAKMQLPQSHNRAEATAEAAVTVPAVKSSVEEATTIILMAGVQNLLEIAVRMVVQETDQAAMDDGTGLMNRDAIEPDPGLDREDDLDTMDLLVGVVVVVLGGTEETIGGRGIDPLVVWEEVRLHPWKATDGMIVESPIDLLGVEEGLRWKREEAIGGAVIEDAEVAVRATSTCTWCVKLPSKESTNIPVAIS
jgi:hypothetical protein